MTTVSVLLILEYIDYADAMKIFDDVGILYPKPLFIGKANEAANYDIKFDSAIPKQLGLPPLPKGKPVLFVSFKFFYKRTRNSN